MIPFADLKPHRGAYVKLNYAARSASSYERGRTPEFTWNDWEVREREGILTFTKDGAPKLNGFALHGWMREAAVHKVEVLWLPPWDSLQFICNRCQKDHPLSVALLEARIPFDRTSAKKNKCSICGRSDNYDKMVVPPEFTKFGATTPHEVIEKEMVSLQFMRKMLDWNAEFVLIDLKRITHPYTSQKKAGVRFESTWAVKKGAEYYHAEHKEPLDAGLWTRWIDFQELKSISQRVAVGGQVLHEVEVAS